MPRLASVAFGAPIAPRSPASWCYASWAPVSCSRSASYCAKRTRLQPRPLTTPSSPRSLCTPANARVSPSATAARDPGREEIRVRAAERGDIADAARVIADVFTWDSLPAPSNTRAARVARTVLQPAYEAAYRLDMRLQLDSRVGRPRHALLLAEVRGEPVGCLELAASAHVGAADDAGPLPADARAFVGNVAVSPAWRRRGVGRSLFDEARRVAEHWGSDAVWLCAEPDSAALVFYERLGFRCVAQEPEWYAEAGGRRRLFLCSRAGVGVDPLSWSDAPVLAARLGPARYLRFCLWDLRRRRNSA